LHGFSERGFWFSGLVGFRFSLRYTSLKDTFYDIRIRLVSRSRHGCCCWFIVRFHHGGCEKILEGHDAIAPLCLRFAPACASFLGGFLPGRKKKQGGVLVLRAVVNAPVRSALSTTPIDENLSFRI